jgi:hypothetical protein
VGSGRSRYGYKFPCDCPLNWRLVMLDGMVDGGDGCILCSIADLADPLLRQGFRFGVGT